MYNGEGREAQGNWSVEAGSEPITGSDGVSQCSEQGDFLGIITGWDPSACNSNRLLHVDIPRFSFTKSGYILP